MVDRSAPVKESPALTGAADIATPSRAGAWLRRNAIRLGLTRRGTRELNEQNLSQNRQIAVIDIAQSAHKIIAITDHAMRSTQERLKASLKQKNEALSPRVLRRTLTELRAVADPAVSEVEGGKRAKSVAAWYAKASLHEQRDMWLLISEQFAPDTQQLRHAREQYESALGTQHAGAAEVAMQKSLASPRRRLLQRFAAFPEGMRFLVSMREQWLPELKLDQRLLALDAELEALLSTWFDVAFLDLLRISWDSPASLLEKLIRYEAVHAINGWSDLKNRLDSDRRCYGFFHPRLPDEPLIFVEVALTDHLAASITSLLDESADLHEISKASTAIFYSISNTQAGLRGVGFGDSLIKRVVETLKSECPRLKTFATLSPIPGFRAWLQKAQPSVIAAHEDDAADAQDAVLAAAAHYLTQEIKEGQPLDAVARFHLGNGACVEQLNPAADPSTKGHKQSLGLMVNYLYDLKQIDKNRQSLRVGKIAYSSNIKKLLNHSSRRQP